MKLKIIKKYLLICCILVLLYLIIIYIKNNYNEYFNSTIGIINNNTLITTHSSGFFSCCSVKLDNIIGYFNTYKKLPEIVDSSKQFEWYKKNKNDDITYEYFDDYNNNINIIWNKDLDYNHTYQFTDYKKLDYENIKPFINKYFSPSLQITTIIKNIEDKYNITDYDNICVVFYRGNDKNTETEICSYDSIISKAKIILNNNKNIKFLIQSDETEFIDTLTNEFPENSFYFKDEIRHMNKQNSTVDIVYKDSNFEFSKKYLAITIIMSKCKYIICPTGNCSIWIMFYRGNSNNIMQFLKNEWV